MTLRERAIETYRETQRIAQEAKEARRQEYLRRNRERLALRVEEILGVRIDEEQVVFIDTRFDENMPSICVEGIILTFYSGQLAIVEYVQEEMGDDLPRPLRGVYEYRASIESLSALGNYLLISEEA